MKRLNGTSAARTLVRRAAAAGATVLGTGALLWPAPASAGYNNEATFDCFGIAPNTWCLYNVRHSYSYLMGSIFDSGYRVCIKLIRDSDGSTYGTFYCSTGSVNHDYGFSVPLTKPEVKNSEVNPFSSDVHGYAQY